MPPFDPAAMRPLPLFVFAAFVAAVSTAAPTDAYYNNDRWTFTTAGGSAGPMGTPLSLTWGIADDGTLVQNVLPGVNRNSNLVAKLDAWYGAGPGGSDLTQRPWFGYLESSFERWEQVSGLTFNYEPNDDGAPHNAAPGNLGVRADIRVAGARYDGTFGTNRGTAAYSIAPDQGDVFLDTDDDGSDPNDTTSGYYNDPAGNAFSLRHTLMHEVGHSLGLGHLNSPSAFVLMEPFTQTLFDGPQHDDIRGVQFLYGDALEKDGGNDTDATATPLGTIAGGSTVSIGTHGGLTKVEPYMTDFVSINRSADIDVFSFSVAGASQIDVTLTPLGTGTNVAGRNANSIRFAISDSFAGDGEFFDINRVYLTDVSPLGAVAPTTLSLEVNTLTGGVTILNPTSAPVSFDSYRIASDAGQLSAAKWLSLADQKADTVGSGAGQNWTEAGGSGSGVLAESFLLGDSELVAGELVALGPVFAGGAQDLTFQYRDTANGQLVTVTPTYVTGPLRGDYNGDGSVNAADYTRWRDGNALADGNNDGAVNSGDYQVWRANYGSSGASAIAVPEPSSLAALGIAGVLTIGCFVRRVG